MGKQAEFWSESKQQQNRRSTESEITLRFETT